MQLGPITYTSLHTLLLRPGLDIIVCNSWLSWQGLDWAKAEQIISQTNNKYVRVYRNESKKFFMYWLHPQKQIQPYILYIQKQIMQQSVLNPYLETNIAATLKTQTRGVFLKS